MPESDSRRQLALLASDSGRSIADCLSGYFIQRVRRCGDSGEPHARTDRWQRWRASRSRLATRCDSAGQGWLPIFGQAGAAQTHLARNRVGPGDLFLFFGSFRRAERDGGALRFVRGAQNLHVIFGWLQVGEVRAVADSLAKEMPWTRRHPHLSAPERFKNNTLYLASERLSSCKLDACGAGIFEQLRPELTLTATDPYTGCSTWRLPRWIHPGAQPALLPRQTISMDCLRDIGSAEIGISGSGIRARPR